MLAAIVITMLAVIGAPAAGASAPDGRQPGDRPAVAVPDGGAPAALPTTSPWVPRVFTTDPSVINCARGYVCAWVDAPGGWYRFTFYNYGPYYLSNWMGWDYVNNAQTGGASVRIYSGTGGQLHCVPAGQFWEVNWDPAWRINLSSTPC